MENYTEHIDLAKALFEKFELPKFDEKYLSIPVIFEMGPQVVVVQEYNSGPAEVDTLAIVGFYIPHDGQCTIAINHMNGLASLDNADLMFPSKED